MQPEPLSTDLLDLSQAQRKPEMPPKSMTFKRARTPHYDDPAAVGKRVFEAREAAGLSQRELAFPGCSAAYISRIERGERVPSLQVMRELARRTGVTEDQLAFGHEKLDPAVAERVRAVEAAEAGGSSAERESAYKALARAATKAARAAAG
jgi:transcriptional regulator with XRE-family HTH domain